jgi:hypothetical protein
MSLRRKIERQKLQKQAKGLRQKFAKEGKRLVRFKDRDGKMKVTAIDVPQPYRKPLEDKA